MDLLIDSLQELRNLAGVPIHITRGGGYRCEEYNRKVDGAKLSQHPKGRAGDFVIEDHTSAEAFVLAERIEAFRHGGLGVYPEKGHLHADVRGFRARWIEGNLPQKKEVGSGSTSSHASRTEGNKEKSEESNKEEKE
jgi:uncharacterized protein YcbK (DUF882 family)